MKEAEQDECWADSEDANEDLTISNQAESLPAAKKRTLEVYLTKGSGARQRTQSFALDTLCQNADKVDIMVGDCKIQKAHIYDIKVHIDDLTAALLEAEHDLEITSAEISAAKGEPM